MKITKENTNLLVVALIAVLLTLQVSSCFKGKQPNERLIRNEMKLEQVEEKRLSDSLSMEARLKEKDAIIAEIKARDTILTLKQIQSNERSKNIPNAVRSLSRDSIYAAATGR